MNLVKRIFVHDTVINPVDQRGVDRCFTKYASALVGAYPNSTIVFSKRKLNIPNIKLLYSSYHYLPDPFPRRITSFIDENFFGAFADIKSDLYYSPYYGKIKCHIPQVFTVHDMIYEKFPNIFNDQGSMNFIEEKKQCFQRAALLLCVSKNTAKDLQAIYPWIPDEKIKIVYNGVDNSYFQDTSRDYEGKPYFLFVGNRYHYKNFVRLLTAFGKSGLSSQFDLRVISPSNDFPTNREKELISQYNLYDSIRVEIAVSEEILKQRYRNAFAYLFPSEYEGFGLPLVEAMASGTVSLVSNTSSLPEIGENVPIYFDPLSIDSIVDVLRYTSTMPDAERDERISLGIVRAKEFTWDNSIDVFLGAIETLF